MTERLRIESAYARRDHPGSYYSYRSADHLARVQERYRKTLELLRRCGVTSLEKLKVLDVGCGEGRFLRQLMDWGARSGDLAGVDLRLGAVQRARRALPGLDLRVASAHALPWRDGTIDLAVLNTVLSSVLDDRMRLAIAREVGRVVRPSGGLLWYDFFVGNPRNPDVAPVGARDLRGLFEGWDATVVRISLAPPIARRLPRRLLEVGYPLLAALPFLRTHLLGFLRKRVR